MSGKYYWFLGVLFIGLAIIVLPVLLLLVMQPPTTLTKETTCRHNKLLKLNILKKRRYEKSSLKKPIFMIYLPVQD